MLAQDFLQGALVYAIAAMVVFYFYARKSVPPFYLLCFLIVSIALGLVQAYIVDLPQGGKDAEKFESVAVWWSEGGFSGAVSRYTGPSSWFLTWLVAVLYSIGAPSSLLPNALSALVTLIGIYFCYRTSVLIWGREISRATLAFVCFFPTILLHSALMMREAYIATLFMIGIYCVVRWRRVNSIVWFSFAHIAFVVGMFFHGAFIAANLALLLFATLVWFRRGTYTLRHRSIVSHSWLLFLAAPIVLVTILLLGVSVPKLGDLSRYIDDDAIGEVLLSRVADSRGGAAHPAWTLVNSEAELVPKLPIRVAYFLFSPFPWDVRSAHHLFGLVDSFLYLVLFWGMFKFRKKLLSKPEVVAVMFIVLCCVVVFSLGTTNFGAGIRHRAKFVMAMIVIAAPYLETLPLFRLRRVTRRLNRQ